jgi:hypothetical protein
MSFKLNVNILSGNDNTSTGRETFNPLLRTTPKTFNPLLRTTPNHIRRGQLEGHISAIRKGQYSWARLRILEKTLPTTVTRARKTGDVWTAHWAEQVLACIEVHGHKVTRS